MNHRRGFQLAGVALVLAASPRVSRARGTSPSRVDANAPAVHTLFGPGVVVPPISLDGIPSHAGWAKDVHYPFSLVSDVDGRVATAYGSLPPGRPYTTRTIFVIGKDGRIAHRDPRFGTLDQHAHGTTSPGTRTGPVAGAHPANPVVPALYEDGRVYVPVSAVRDPSHPRDTVALGWFILDTGAEATLIDSRVAARLSLRVRDAGEERGAGAGALREGRSRGLRLRVGPVPYAPRELVVAPLDSLLAPSSGRHIAGIVGSQFFMEHTLELTPPWSGIQVDRPPRRGDGASSAVVLPFELHHSLPFVQGSIALHPRRSGAPLSLRLLVDLGAKAPLLLTEGALRKAGGERALPRHVLASLGAGVGGETRYFFTRASRVTVGRDPHRVGAESVLVGFSALSTLRSTSFDGLLGAPFLARYDVRIDYAHRELTLTDAAAAADSVSDFDESGLFLTTRRVGDVERIFVHRVVTGSPADRAGIEPAVELLDIDGVAVTRLGLSEVRRRLRGPDGRDVVLGARRAGRLVSFHLRLAPLI